MKLKKNNESYETEGLHEAAESSTGKRIAIGFGKRVLTVLAISTVVTLALAGYDNYQQGLGILPIRETGSSYITHSVVKTTYTDEGVEQEESYCTDSKEKTTRDCLTIKSPYYEKEGEIFYDKQIFYDGDNAVKLSDIEKQHIKDTIYDPEGLVEQDFIKDVMQKTKTVTEKSSLTEIPTYNGCQISYTTTEENKDKTQTEIITREDADQFNQKTFNRGAVFAGFGGLWVVAGTAADAIDIIEGKGKEKKGKTLTKGKSKN